jgi:hypothetical protein
MRITTTWFIIILNHMFNQTRRWIYDATFRSDNLSTDDQIRGYVFSFSDAHLCASVNMQLSDQLVVEHSRFDHIPYARGIVVFHCFVREWIPWTKRTARFSRDLACNRFYPFSPFGAGEVIGGRGKTSIPPICSRKDPTSVLRCDNSYMFKIQGE